MSNSANLILDEPALTVSRQPLSVFMSSCHVYCVDCDVDIETAKNMVSYSWDTKLSKLSKMTGVWNFNPPTKTNVMRHAGEMEKCD